MPDWLFTSFSCLAGRARDMVGQLLAIRLELKANWMQKFPWKEQQDNQNPQNTHEQTLTAREIRKTKWDKMKQNVPLSTPQRFSSTVQ